MEVLFVAHLQNVTIVAPVRPGAPFSGQPLLSPTPRRRWQYRPAGGLQGALINRFPQSTNPAPPRGPPLTLASGPVARAEQCGPLALSPSESPKKPLPPNTYD